MSSMLGEVDQTRVTSLFHSPCLQLAFHRCVALFPVSLRSKLILHTLAMLSELDTGYEHSQGEETAPNWLRQQRAERLAARNVQFKPDQQQVRDAIAWINDQGRNSNGTVAWKKVTTHFISSLGSCWG